MKKGDIMKYSPIRSRKAQDAGSAATLVTVIALLIIFYLLFIPPAYRDQILEGNESSSSGSSSTSSESGESVLKAAPGTLSPLKSEEIEHNIPSITLFAKTNSKVLHSANAVYVKSSIFGQKKTVFNFQVDDVSKANNVLLTFRRTSGSGDLIITLNGEEIYSGLVTKENPDPIRLSEAYLVSGKNTLEFSSEKTGFAFWRRNRQNLESLQVSADIRDTSRQQSENVFIVSATEKSNVKRSVLRFTPDCTLGRVGKLNVFINSHSIYYSVPDCGGRVAIEFPPEVLREGENRILFESEEGSYLIDLIRITSELKAIIQPAYYFEVSEDDMAAIRDGDWSFLFRLTFIDDSELKAAKVNINGREFNVYQTEREFEKDINDYVVEGNNAIKITPDNTVEIVSLEVVKD